MNHYTDCHTGCLENRPSGLKRRASPLHYLIMNAMRLWNSGGTRVSPAGFRNHHANRIPTSATKTFPLTLDLEFRTLCGRGAAMGTGRTVWMGSREILFKADRPIAPQTRVELSVEWPVLLLNQVGLRLIIDGLVSRAEGDSITVSICKHQFRTRPLSKERQVSTNILAFPNSDLAVRSWRAVSGTRA